ncbi:MAG: hypothetical protein CM1200mP39_09100 [Dehalococcoidia bacterium]|nr:MAG: hypothetical protein CM1200mP39_09100 [Dehalococcoidia bacterium]
MLDRHPKIRPFKQEPQVQSSISDGATLTLFSGDKLIGGPQAGLIAGEQKWIDLVSKHPLARAVRIDKVALSAISATLVSYLTGTHEKEIPIWTMIALSESNLADRSENWRSKTGQEPLRGLDQRLEEDHCQGRHYQHRSYL